MELERLARVAKSVKFDGFKMHFRQYIASLKSAEEPTSEAEDQPYSAFDDQPLELFTGDWRTDNTGVWHYQGNGKEYACSHPIMPVQILKSVDTRRYKVKLIFRRGGNRSKKPWDEIIVDSEKLASATKIVDALSPVGVSITSGKRAYNMIDYLRDVMDWNVDTIPEIKSVSRMGWNDEGFYPYAGKNIAFDSAKEFDRTYRAIKQVGKYEAWLQEAREARTYSLTARIVLAASFAAPLIEPLGCSSFFVHLWGTASGTGKTVAQMLAAAAWAYPPRGGGFFYTFNGTNVGVEVLAGFLHSLPLFIDETQQAKDKNGVMKFNVYDLTSESGRLRSNQNLGMNYVPTWKSCFITSGESRITKDTDGEGALNRVIEIECREGEYVIKDGHRTSGVVTENYGWAGKEFIERLTEDGQIDRAKSLYEQFLKSMLESNTTDKQAMAAAALLTADTLATEWIFKDGRELSIDEISSFMRTRESVSLMERGYEIICGWVAVNAVRFQGLGEDDGLDKYGAIIDYDGGEKNVACIIRRPVFDDLCDKYGLPQDGVLSHMRSKGLIITGKKGYTKTHRVNGISQNCVWLRLPKPVDDGEENGENMADEDEVIL